MLTKLEMISNQKATKAFLFNLSCFISQKFCVIQYLPFDRVFSLSPYFNRGHSCTFLKAWCTKLKKYIQRQKKTTIKLEHMLSQFDFFLINPLLNVTSRELKRQPLCKFSFDKEFFFFIPDYTASGKEKAKHVSSKINCIASVHSNSRHLYCRQMAECTQTLLYKEISNIQRRYQNYTL